MIDMIRSDIAYKARQMGLEFDDSEIVDVIDSGYRIVFLRSIKAIRQVEQPDGSVIDEKFNDPIIWMEYPSPNLMRCEIDQERQVIHYSIPQPQLRIRYPMLILRTPAPGAC